MRPLLFLFALAPFLVMAQVKPIIDSLREEASKEKDPQELSAIYSELVTQWAEANFDSSFFYSRKLYSLAVGMDDPILLSKALMRLGTPHDYHSHFDSAAYYYEKSLANSNQHGDSSGIASASFALATLYYFKGDYPTAIEKYNTVEKMFIALGDERRLARLYNNLGEIYGQTAQYSAAIIAFQNSLTIKERINDVKGILNTYFNLSKLYQQIGDYSQAEAVSLKAVALSQDMNDRMAYKNELLNLGRIYQTTGALQKSLLRLKEAESFLVPGDPVIFRTECWISLASVYLALKNHPMASTYLTRFESGMSQLAPDALIPYYRLNSERYAAMGDFGKAYDFHQKYSTELEKVTGEKIKARTKELEVQYESEKKERQISQLELDKQKASFELVQNENQRNLFIAVSLGLLVIIALVYYQFRQKQTSNLLLTEKNQTIARSLAERETLLREIHHRVKNNLQIISSLLSLQSRNVHDEAAQVAVNESRNRVKSMSLIHEQLYTEANVAGVSMLSYMEHLVESLANSYGVNRDKVELRVHADPFILDVDTAIPLGLILNELVSNAFKYAFPNGRQGKIAVTLRREGDELKFSVLDDGVGMSEEKKSRNSFGFSLVNSLMRKLKAEMTIRHEQGTCVELRIRDYKIVAMA